MMSQGLCQAEHTLSVSTDMRECLHACAAVVLPTNHTNSTIRPAVHPTADAGGMSLSKQCYRPTLKHTQTQKQALPLVPGAEHTMQLLGSSCTAKHHCRSATAAATPLAAAGAVVAAAAVAAPA